MNATRATNAARASRPAGPAILAVIAAVAVAVELAPAQTSRPARPAAAPAPMGLLAGPRVVEEGDDRPLASDRPRRSTRGAMPPRRWFQLYRDLDLDPAQREAMTTVMAEMGREREAFERKHGAALRTLRRQVRSARASDEMPSRDLREKMAALSAEAPKVEVYQERLWTILTMEQQEALRAAIGQARAEMRRRRQERRGDGAAMDRRRRRGDDRRPTDGDAPAPGPPGGKGRPARDGR